MTPMNNRRVVITGCGAVTPIGIGKEAFWNALERGENGADFITLFDTAQHTTKIAAEVKDFNPENWLDKKEVRRTDRVIHFAAAAADLAVEDSGLDIEKLDKNLFGVYVGSGEGGIHTLEENSRVLYEKGPNRVSPFMVPMMITNMPAAYIAIRFGAKGPNMAVVTACASSINSMGEAYNCIARGDADVMLTGGAEAAVSPLATAGFASLKALSNRNDDPKHASRPFDAERDGFVIGEGAGILVFEEYEHAKARGAHIYAEVTGYGLSCDAHHITAPDPDGDGAYRAMAMAVKKSGWQPEEIDLINAHGTSTPLNDKMETMAIKRLLGEDNAKKVLVHSTKSMVGHALGAAGAIETIATLLAIDKGIVHPTINQITPDPDCDLNTVPNKAAEAKVDRAIINNFGFGGHNGVLAIQSCKD
ncbi:MULTISPECIES: beta-ketoacyl-ACP synthase II [Cloacibacillus]|mgnify:FL=1|nr:MULTISPECIES: beta-ketoacyl-ACP synthase II [Cloacibacillus]MCC8184656.1 beta-ketoacyl-ACP synthase II [Cloacibacillus porcorum]MCI5866467.1 beta-ketoacyl-ACP synthase II [Cloacibacillus porcorum]MDD7650185.1 beta-ketoacyl-ACP synthase II [Cloacibacillus porcorum]MDY4092706.1 beta-ketoacyl-ACP synthase II [Cloacibacillus porcorum]MDY5389526.1 beta-ketoacyl-ACP synthase II [Cloacibacillus porcorum]